MAKKKQKKKKSVPIAKDARGWFNAASYDRFNADWALSDVPINDALLWGLEAMRARSRDLSRNNEYMKRFLQLLKQNVPGPSGIRFKNDSRFMSGAKAGSLNVTQNAQVEALFKRWSAKDAYDSRYRMTRTTAEWLYIETLAKDGEVFILKDRNRGALGFSLRFLDAARFPTQLNDFNPANGNRIVMSVEMDAIGAPVAFWMLKQLRNTNFTTPSFDPQEYERLEAENCIHDYIQIDAEQVRGMPAAHAAMRTLKDLGGWKDAAIINARVGANKNGFWETPDGQFVGDEETPDGVLFQDIAPGEQRAIPTGYKLHSWDPTYPHTETSNFNTAMLRGLASGLGAFYPTLANDFSSINLSAIRGGLQDEREGYKMLQQFMIDSFENPLVADWTRMMVLRGHLPPNVDVVPNWRPRRWASPEPLRDAQADSMNLSARTTSRQRICDSRGLDWYEVLEDLAEEEEAMDDKGITPTVLGSFQPDNGDGDQADETPEEDREPAQLQLIREIEQ